MSKEPIAWVNEHYPPAQEEIGTAARAGVQSIDAGEDYDLLFRRGSFKHEE